MFEEIISGRLGWGVCALKRIGKTLQFLKSPFQLDFYVRQRLDKTGGTVRVAETLSAF